jgi:CDGSH-type Zn-finger protein
LPYISSEPAHNALFKVTKDGPIQVSGNYQLRGSDGKIINSDSVIYLCRCGHSGNNPFCDGTHKKAGLRD